MPNWFRKGLSPHQTALAMVGAKAGDHVVIVGASDPALAAEIARVTALTGQTVVCDSAEGAGERVSAAAAEAGALVEFEAAAPAALPFESGSRDISVIMASLAVLDAAARSAAVAEAVRVLRPGGRLLIIDGERTAGFLGSLRRSRANLPTETVLTLLENVGTRAKRQLANVDGVVFYEARRPA